MTFTSCKDCTDRYPGCSGDCERYKKERDIWEAKKKFLNPNPALRAYVRTVTGENKNTTIKRKQRGRK